MSELGETTGDTPEQLPDLRSLTRETVRAQIAETAWSVFAERGFDDVTVNEVAEATGISRASFFRYFSSKEEAVHAALGATGARIAAAVAARPASERPWTALRKGFLGVVGEYEEDRAGTLARVRLTREVPSVRAYQLEKQDEWRGLIGAALAARGNASAHDLEIEAVVGAAITALDVAATHWADSDGQADFVELLERAFAAVRRG